MSLPENAVIFVERAELVEELKIRLTFNDGRVQTVDFGPFLHRSRNPLIRAYLDGDTFSRFTVREGDLVWGDYDLCFPVADLYDGKV